MRINLVNDDFQAKRVGAGNQLIKIGQSPEQGVDITIVGNVITVVFHGRGKKRRKPDAIHPETGYIVQLADNPGKVTNPVASRIKETARIDLVDDRATPPVLSGSCHQLSH